MNTGKRTILSLVLVVFLLLLAGCGAGGGAAAPAEGGEEAPGGQAAESAGTVITREDQGKTIEIKVGDQVQVKLGPDYDWAVDATPSLMLGEVKEGVPEDAQGVYEAKRKGKATIQVTGKPTCLQNDPPCEENTLQFTVTLVINAAE